MITRMLNLSLAPAVRVCGWTSAREITLSGDLILHLEGPAPLPRTDNWPCV